MITQELLSYPIIPYAKLFSTSINAFLELFEGVLDCATIEEGMTLDFDIDTRINNSKLSPILRLAKPDDAHYISAICREVYQGTYPYREIMDEKHVRAMIKSPKHYFILFLIGGEVIGCFRCALEFDQKKGYMGGFMLLEPYQGTVDVVKAIIGSYVWMWNTFREEILVWYCENRTAHAASQYITAVCGIHTIALFPNKDIFFKEVESDVMGIIYQDKVFTNLRAKQVPQLIEDSIDCFLYTDELYGLGNFSIVPEDLELDMDKVEAIRKRILISIREDDHQYQHVSFSIVGSNSKFSFLHTPHIQNCEKINYHFNSNEEFFVLLEFFTHYMQEHRIRYSEIFVSAYNPDHQKIINAFDFHARGYVPNWKYNKKKGVFEDYIVFNWYRGGLTDLDLLAEGSHLLELVSATTR